ncbi:MAG: hypothetical protein RIS94_2353, partial [Pseudomonadota bacterium]
RAALEGAGLSQEAVNRADDAFRIRDRERLTMQIESGDMRVARDRIITETIPQPEG